MKEFAEEALWIECTGTHMLAILARPGAPAGDQEIRPGILIVVGGPQYRVGSHRQFTLLARRLAAHGYPTLRFDYRGMGDSCGAARGFTEVAEDLAAASAKLQASTEVREVVLWGLCDAASAILLNLPQMPNVCGIVLVNPWVRSTAGQATTQLKHYYVRRLVNRAFWGKLLTGRLDWQDTLGSFRRTLRAAVYGGRSDAAGSDRDDVAYQTRMANGLRRFGGPVLLALSGDDLTAKEFVEYTSRDPAWRGVLARSGVSHVELPVADHTFSCALWRGWLEDQTLAWLERLHQTGSLLARAQPVGVAR
jgi:exosortase A-associated hydrolase 1